MKLNCLVKLLLRACRNGRIRSSYTMKLLEPIADTGLAPALPGVDAEFIIKDRTVLVAVRFKP